MAGGVSCVSDQVHGQPRTQALSTTRLAGGKTPVRVSQILGDNN
jgi:hypothetical protein